MALNLKYHVFEPETLSVSVGWGSNWMEMLVGLLVMLMDLLLTKENGSDPVSDRQSWMVTLFSVDELTVRLKVKLNPQPADVGLVV